MHNLKNYFFTKAEKNMKKTCKNLKKKGYLSGNTKEKVKDLLLKKTKTKTEIFQKKEQRLKENTDKINI